MALVGIAFGVIFASICGHAVALQSHNVDLGWTVFFSIIGLDLLYNAIMFLVAIGMGSSHNAILDQAHETNEAALWESRMNERYVDILAKYPDWEQRIDWTRVKQ